MIRAIAVPVGLIIGIVAALALDQRLMLALAAVAVVTVIVNAALPKKVESK